MPHGAKVGRPPTIEPKRNSLILRLLWDVYRTSGLTQEELIRDAGVTQPDSTDPVDGPANVFRDALTRAHRIHVQLVDYVLDRTLAARDWRQRARAALLHGGVQSKDIDRIMTGVERVRQKRRGA